MSQLDLIYCFIAGLSGAVSYPLVMGVKDPWTFVRSTIVGTILSGCLSHLVVMLLTSSGIAPSLQWDGVWPCAAVSYLLGLMGNVICRSLLESYDQRAGFIGKIFDYLLGEKHRPDPRMTHRPDSDLPGAK